MDGACLLKSASNSARNVADKVSATLPALLPAFLKTTKTNFALFCQIFIKKLIKNLAMMIVWLSYCR